MSTEHNIDAWQTLHLAANVLNDPSYSAAATTLDTAIVNQLWNRVHGRFNQGLNSDESADTTDPLDVNSWGALYLLDAGHPDTSPPRP